MTHYVSVSAFEIAKPEIAVALKQKARTERDLWRLRILYEVLNNPVWFAELTWLRMGAVDGVTKKPWKVFPMRLDPMLSMRHATHMFDGSGRNQSKSEQIKVEIKQFPIRCLLKGMKRKMLFLCPNEVHRKALDLGYAEMAADPFLKLLVTRKKEDPEYTIEFKDGSMLYGAIPGANGRNFPGHHVDEILGEEACWFTKGNLSQLGGCKNPGCTERWYGTKNGDNSSPMYERDTEAEFDYYKRFAIPSTAHPYYPLMRQAMMQDFGKPGTYDWEQNVLAKWGQPTNYAFNEYDIERCYSHDGWFEHQTITEKDVRTSKDNPDYKPVEAVFRPPADAPKFKDVLVGWDPGVQQDSEMTAWGSPDGSTVPYQLFFRLTIKRVRTAFQVLILDRICEEFKPDRVGIDVGGEGRLAADLLEQGTLKGLKYNYRGRIVNVQFGETVPTGAIVKDANGKDVEATEYTKKVSVDYLSELLFRGSLRFGDLTLKSDLQCFWYTITTNNRYVYKATEDHLICSVLSFSMAHRARYFKGENKRSKTKFVGIIPIFAKA